MSVDDCHTEGDRNFAFLFEALLFHTLFCSWMVGDSHRRSVNDWAGRLPDHSGLIVSIGPAGIYARSHQTVEFDASIGVALPAALIAAAAFVLSLQNRSSAAGAKVMQAVDQ
jgi:hypothetical protein